jgi:hypothetical protein
MDDLPAEVLHQIREHVAAARAEWGVWQRDLEEQRLTGAVRDNTPRRHVRQG